MKVTAYPGDDPEKFKLRETLHENVRKIVICEKSDLLRESTKKNILTILHWSRGSSGGDDITKFEREIRELV